MNMEATQVYVTSVSSSDEEGYETGEESGEDEQPEESDAETNISDEAVTTDHSGPASDTESETESEAEEQRTYEQDVLSTMPTKYMSKSQRRKVRRNLYEISEGYMTESTEVFATQIPKQISYKPRPRKPGKWRVQELFTWTAMVTIVAGMMDQWQAFEPITLPRWDLLEWEAQDSALRLLEENDIDFTVVAWPCTPWSIMQNMNRRPHQIRALNLQRDEHRRLLIFVERVAHRMYMRKRANVGENPASSAAWEEPPIQAAFNRPGNSETITHMCVHITNGDPTITCRYENQQG
jgi:hypothetical protein